MSTSASIGVRQSMYSCRPPECRSFVSAMLNDAPNKRPLPWKPTNSLASFSPTNVSPAGSPVSCVFETVTPSTACHSSGRRSSNLIVVPGKSRRQRSTISSSPQYWLSAANDESVCGASQIVIEPLPASRMPAQRMTASMTAGCVTTCSHRPGPGWRSSCSLTQFGLSTTRSWGRM